ncbi:Zn-ribbon domain-containing OB-fold protein [Paraconexibacter sp.]|uniref:Zn-ribbon domain-containing OB-fold protein n=1 Tax=Paraconexibacter sp. TaxID=2949640 RepID=UPI0035663F25
MEDATREPAPDATWDAYARRRELAYQVTSDGTPVFRPRVGAAVAWAISRGRGTVYATTTVRPRGAEPYDLTLVELDEGFRMMSHVVGVAPEDVRIGQRVVLEWEDREGEDAVPVPVFRLDEDAS